MKRIFFMFVLLILFLVGCKPVEEKTTLNDLIAGEYTVQYSPPDEHGNFDETYSLGKLNLADGEYDLFVGKGYLTENKLFAKIGSNFRNFTTGTLLSGSGPVVLVGDLATTFNNAALRGWNPWMAVLKSLREHIVDMFLKNPQYLVCCKSQ